MKNYVRNGLIMMAGIVTLPAVVSHADSHHARPECKSTDPRFQLLRSFFHRNNSPIEHLTSAFIQEADANHLDWRLLPGLTVIESGAGLHFRGNNLFGWNNGISSFKTVREGIHFVAERLAHSPSYQGKSSAGKLDAYNANEGYRESVEAVMFRISRSKPLK